MNLIKFDIIDSNSSKIVLKENYNSLSCIYFSYFIRFCDETLIEEYYRKIEDRYKKLLDLSKEDASKKRKILVKKRKLLRKLLSHTFNNFKRNDVIDLKSLDYNLLKSFNLSDKKILVYHENYIDLIFRSDFERYISSKNYEINKESTKSIILKK